METLRTLYEKHGGEQYFGEKVTEYQHALQSAYSAEQYDPNDHQLIIAAFLHDVGHLLGKKKDDYMGHLGVFQHERIGAEYLKNTIGLSERICNLVKNHVNAKRYLTFVDKTYHDRLSEASKQTLVYQGGPMNEQEAEEFRSNPDFELCLKMRTFDEAAKEIHFDHYEEKTDYYWKLVEEQLRRDGKISNE